MAQCGTPRGHRSTACSQIRYTADTAVRRDTGELEDVGICALGCTVYHMEVFSYCKAMEEIEMNYRSCSKPQSRSHWDRVDRMSDMARHRCAVHIPTCGLKVIQLIGDVMIKSNVTYHMSADRSVPCQYSIHLDTCAVHSSISFYIVACTCIEEM